MPDAMPGGTRSKVQPTPVRDDTLGRARLIDWLRETAGVRLKLIVAEAGYGKTTLLADFSRYGGTRCIWYKLESSDRDWITFINYVVAAIREVTPTFGAATTAVLAQLATTDLSRDVVLDRLMAELSSLDDTPTILILDDFHLVDDSEDVEVIVRRLLRSAPDWMSLLISSRRRPSLQLGRIAAQGQLAELDTSELRFSKDETRELFSAVYRQPLDPDVLDQVDARTEGWAASLRLLHSSIRHRRPSEIREFIRAMSGAEGSLYDFLAEEVLAHLPSELETFVVRAALLDRIVPEYVAAIFHTEPGPTAVDAAIRWTEATDELGLLARSGSSTSSRRFHPLLLDFLRRQLEQRTTPDERRAMHTRVAQTAERSDWLAACKHYVDAGMPADAMRVLADSLGVVVGTGLWGPASQVLGNLDVSTSHPAVAVINARRLISEDRTDEALELLARVDMDSTPSVIRAEARQARMTAHLRSGNRPGLRQALEESSQDTDIPPRLRDLAEALRQFLLSRPLATASVDIHTVAQRFSELGSRQEQSGEYYFAAISYHNAMLADLWAGRYREGLDLGDAALAAFKRSGVSHSERFSTHAGLATCALELRLVDRMWEELNLATNDEGAHADAYAECAVIASAIGDMGRAQILLEAAERQVASHRGGLLAAAPLPFARAALHLTRGDTDEARASIDEALGMPDDFGLELLRATYSPLVDACRGVDGGPSTDVAIDQLRARGAWRAVHRLQVVVSAIRQDRGAFKSAVTSAARSGEMALLETADVIVANLALVDVLPDAIVTSLRTWPQRWLPSLRRHLTNGNNPSSHVCARVLAEYGELADVSRVRAFERSYMKRRRGPSLAQSLAKRTSPRMRVNDLGRTEFHVGSHTVPISHMRRKSAALLVYVISRPGATATREQVMDDLWPDLDPDSAANSLNQTLYFLRRDIDPWYEDGVSANYVVYESELMWLDSELVAVDSIAFRERSRGAIANGADIALARSALALYRGRFAPEFEYEDWAMAWRDGLHATYLHLAETTVSRMCESGMLRESTELCQLVLGVEPAADGVERALIWVYGRIGAASAATEQYQHLARSMRQGFGVEPPSLRDVLATPPWAVTAASDRQRGKSW